MPTPVIRLSAHLALPINCVTESIGILAKRRAGKSTTGRRLAEQLHRAKQQVVIVDPKGDWWGLLFARDGKAPGLPFVVLGGEHGHITLEAGAGELVARLVVTEGVSLVLDLSTFRKHEVATFMTAFLETLYRLKAQERYRTPVMLIVDEADAIAPQRPPRGEERMLGAMEDLVRRGGQRGIGVTMLTQRSAVLNKNVLTQIGILIVLRTIAPQDLAAMDAWIDVHGEAEQRKQLMDSLPSLPVGTGWVWAPGWPDAEGVFQRCAFLLPETFDSSKTPDGKLKAEPKHAADVDLEAFQREMAATIERAKADDPRELRKRIAELERALTKAPPSVVPPAPRVVEKPVLTDAQIARLEKLLASYQQLTQTIMERLQAAVPTPLSVVAQPGRARTTGAGAARPGSGRTMVGAAPARAHTPTPPRSREVAGSNPADGHSPSGVAQRLLNSLAELEQLGSTHPSRQLAAFMAGYTNLNSKGFVNAIGGLRSSELVDYPSGGSIALTPAGRALAQPPPAPRSVHEVRDRVVQLLGGASARILDPLISVYPDSLQRVDVAQRAGYTNLNSKGFVNAIGRLRTLGFVEYPDRGTLRAAPVLFLEGVR